MSTHEAGSNPIAPRGFAVAKLLRCVAIVVAVLLLLVFALSFWLLRTESGLRFVLARAAGASGGRMSIEQSSGALAGKVALAGVRYRDAGDGIDVAVQKVDIAFEPLGLLVGRLRITQLDLAGVEVALTSVPPKPEAPAEPLSLVAPLDIQLERLSLKDAQIAQDGERVLTIDALDVTGAWTREGVALKSLALRSPDGSVDLDGTVSALPGYPGTGATTFRWKVADNEYAGRLDAQSDGKDVRLDLALSAPTPAAAQITLTQSGQWPWSARVQVPRFDPDKLIKDSGLAALALDLEGSGDKDRGALHGEVGINEHRVQLDPLRYALDGKVLKIEALSLRSPEAAGVLNANGEVQLDAEPVSASLALDWQGVELPADLVGQPLATHGRLDASGSAERYHAKGTFAIGPPGKLSDIALDLDGTPQSITLTQLALKQTRGGLDARGTVTLEPALGWQLTAKADKLDPGAFAADWPGALDFDLTTNGTLTDNGPDATIKLDRLGGSLRKRPVSGSADLAIKPGYIVDGKLSLASGKSRIEAIGRGGNQTDATITLAIATLADWLPDAGGALDGTFRVQGKWPQLAINGNAHGAKIALGETRIESLDLRTDLVAIQPPQGTLHLSAANISSGALVFDTLELDGSGNRQAHELGLTATGTPLGLTLALSGRAGDDGRWNGSLRTLDLAIKDAPPLTLEAPAQLAWDGKQFSATETCLVGGGPRLCVAGNSGADGALAARYRIEQLPLALVARLAAPDAPFQVDGMIAGNGDIQRAANGTLGGSATLNSAQGSIAYTDKAGQPLLSYSALALDAQLSPQSTHATLRAALDHDGKLDGEITLSGAPDSAQALSGRVDLVLNNLGFVELLTPEVANTKGRVAANYTIAGTTAAPQLNGALTLKEFATEIPSAGLKLHDGDITVRATDAEHFTLEGTLKSGEGSLTLSGSGGVGPTSPLKASIKGEKFLAADIPAARVVITPDLTIERSAENISIGGSIGIPEANVDLDKLPGGGVSKKSPDVVITDAEQPEAGQPLPVVVALQLELGRNVKLAGMGLDGKIRGQLRVDQRPGKLATGTGTLNVSGTYKAYGQNLNIETGRLLFAGTALDNPGLDIRAVRKILGSSGGQGDDTISAGLQVRGTALVPVLTVFSSPAMQQSEALSYLITGKPLSGLKSGEGDMLGSAARALGSAGGDLLAKGIGARVGVDAGVSDSSALGGSAFTVGKYLSPKLYLSYGVGLFTPGEVVTLKYLFSRRWNFEAENATTGSRAGVNYRYER
jgi:translocation and assembly module TamB